MVNFKLSISVRGSRIVVEAVAGSAMPTPHTGILSAITSGYLADTEHRCRRISCILGYH